MKNFLDLLDIDPGVNISIRLRALCGNGVPRCRMTVNDRVIYDDFLSSECIKQFSVSLMSSIQIKVEMSDKIYSEEKETAIVIDQLAIDGFAIVPDWTHLARYENDHDANGPASYLGYNGCWTLEINEPFHRWRHRVTGQGWLLEPTTGFRG